MAKYKGNNDIFQSSALFYYRTLYSQQAFSENDLIDERQQQIRDLTFAENVLYGRVDTRLNTVLIKEDSLHTMASEDSSENSVRLLNFVADAFEAFRERMRMAVSDGDMSPDDPIFSRISIKKSYTSPTVLYNNYITQLMKKYSTDFLDLGKNRKHVFNLSDFIEYFFLYLKMLPDHTPITFTSWQRSTTSNIFTSGMAVDIAGVEYGDDGVTENLMLNSPCFPMYLKYCKSYGFFVSKTAPSIMVADVLSPALAPFAGGRNVYTTEQVFLYNYDWAYTIDYDLMVNAFLDAYNEFVSLFPEQRVTQVVCKKNISVKYNPRFPITNQAAIDKISQLYWGSIYARIRNIEEEGALNKRSFDNLQKKIKMMKNIDNFRMMRYINSTFRDTYKSKYGGYNYYVERQEERNAKDFGTSKITAVGSTATEPTTETVSLADTTTTIPVSTGGSTGGTSGGY